MNVKIFVGEDRKLRCSNFYIGTQNEENATIITIETTDSLREYSKNLIVNNSLGSFSVPLENESVALPCGATHDERFELQIELKKAEKDIGFFNRTAFAQKATQQNKARKNRSVNL